MVTRNSTLNWLISLADRANTAGRTAHLQAILCTIDRYFYPLSILPNR